MNSEEWTGIALGICTSVRARHFPHFVYTVGTVGVKKSGFFRYPFKRPPAAKGNIVTGFTFLRPLSFRSDPTHRMENDEAGGVVGARDPFN